MILRYRIVIKMVFIKGEPEDTYPTWEERSINGRIIQGGQQGHTTFSEDTGNCIRTTTESIYQKDISENLVKNEEASDSSQETGIDRVTIQVSVCMEDDEFLREKSESGIAVVIKTEDSDVGDEESNVEHQIEQNKFLKYAEEMMGAPSASAATSESGTSGKRQIRKTKRMLKFEASGATTPPVAKKSAPLKIHSEKTAKKTARIKPSQAKKHKLQDAMQRAKVQQALCQQMLNSKAPSFDTSTPTRSTAEGYDDDDDDDYDVDDDCYQSHSDLFENDEDHSPVHSITPSVEVERAAEISTLKKKVRELEAQLQVAQNRISELETPTQKSAVPNIISVVVTPKKLQLIKDMYQILESKAGVAPSGPSIMENPELQMTPKTTEKLTSPPTKSSQELTPLYPGGKPVLAERAKCIAFSKGKCKESLLYALLTEVFGEDVLARSNALGSRQAVNKIDTDEYHPLDKDKLHEIKECVLQRHPLKSGLPCMDAKEFNHKINQKCATSRRALKRKLNK